MRKENQSQKPDGGKNKDGEKKVHGKVPAGQEKGQAGAKGGTEEEEEAKTVPAVAVKTVPAAVAAEVEAELLFLLKQEQTLFKDLRRI